MGGVADKVRGGRGKDPVYAITGARRGIREDVESRTRRYVISMAVRTVCFLLAVVLDGWLRWVMIAAALVLPYLSVVFANGGRERVVDLPAPDISPPPRAIDAPGT